ncbi:MAG: flagellar biosynthesis protein FlgA [Clostridia bacterium]
MLYHHAFEKLAKQSSVKAALVGGGNYGTAIVTQSVFNKYLTINAVADTNIANAKKAFREANIPDSDICSCKTVCEAKAAIKQGKYVVTDNPDIIFDLDIDVVAEATGVPEAGAYHAKLALEKNKHLVMITKDTDSVIGPVLYKMFKEKDLVYTPVDGDQPALLMQLVEWARIIGLEVVSAGKSRDGEFIYDEKAGTVTHPADEKKGIPEPVVVNISPENAKYLEFIPEGKAEEYLQKRNEILGGLPKAAGFDFCEIVMIANATGLCPDVETLHQGTLRVNEIPIAYCSEKNGGIYKKEGIIDLITCLRRKEEASMGGGVYLVVRSNNAYSQMILTTKGLIGNYDNSVAVIAHPYHLCGVESSTSLMSAAMLGIDTGAKEYIHRFDLARRAARDLSAGTVCGTDRDTNLQSFIAPAARKSGSSPIPAHMLNGNKLKVDVKAGSVITYDMVEEPANSVLWDFRRRQEEFFLK